MYHAALERCLSLHGYGLYRLVSQSQCPSPGKVHPESATMLSLPSTMCCDMNRFMLRSTKLSHSKSCAPLRIHAKHRPHSFGASSQYSCYYMPTSLTRLRGSLRCPSSCQLLHKDERAFPIHSVSLRSYPTPYFPSRQEAVLWFYNPRPMPITNTHSLQSLAEIGSFRDKRLIG